MNVMATPVKMVLPVLTMRMDTSVYVKLATQELTVKKVSKLLCAIFRFILISLDAILKVLGQFCHHNV